MELELNAQAKQSSMDIWITFVLLCTDTALFACLFVCFVCFVFFFFIDMLTTLSSLIIQIHTGR